MLNLPTFCKDLRKCIVKGIKKYLNLDTCVQLCAFNFVQNAKCNGFMVARHNHLLSPTNLFEWAEIIFLFLINICHIDNFVSKLEFQNQSLMEMNIYLNNMINPNWMSKVQVNSEIFQKVAVSRVCKGNIRSNYDGQLCNS